ncbi:MAG TPA: efflux RND transporter periplasmic adaptor subunit [Polyangiaceae bacterium]|nr:efflux RND transporter periplasmic adaptor subunit [Polyangiaceae bacterium]
MTSQSPSLPSPSKRSYGARALAGVALLSAALSAGVAVLVPRFVAHGSNSAHGQADAVLYHCPMHPTIIQDHPGNCPICGMKLVKIAKDDRKESWPSADTPSAAPVASLASIEIDPERQQLIGLKTAEVKTALLGGSIRSVGRVAIDETRVRRVNLKVPGFVERIYVDYVGKKVKKGDPLFSVYSPELLATQEEYLLAQKTQNELGKVGGFAGASENGLSAGARRKLELWDIPALTLDQIVKSGKPSKSLTLYSPIAGVVTKKDVVEGMRLEAGAMPYEITDLSTVWVLVDVYESELRFVRDGMAATLSLSAFPNRDFTGKVVFLDPLLDPATRTVKARLTFPNPSGELRPEMFGDVVLRGEPRTALTVPLDALIDSGIEKVVFLALPDGKFEPRSVEVGERDQTQIEVTRGLSAGDRVVIRANFLVDSESRLRASLSPVAPAMDPKLERARVLPEGAPAPSPSGRAP